MPWVKTISILENFKTKIAKDIKASSGSIKKKMARILDFTSHFGHYESRKRSQVKQKVFYNSKLFFHFAITHHLSLEIYSFLDILFGTYSKAYSGLPSL